MGENTALDYLKQIEFQIVGFRHSPKDWVIRRLLVHLNLPQSDTCISRRMAEHGLKHLV